jgi:hypothetical protein
MVDLLDMKTMTTFDSLITPIEGILEGIFQTATQFNEVGKLTFFEKMGFAYEFLPGTETDITTNAYHIAIERDGELLVIVSLIVGKSDLSIDKYNKIREDTFRATINLFGSLGVMGVINRVKMRGDKFYYLQLYYDPNKTN